MPAPLADWHPHLDAWLLIFGLAGAYTYALLVWGPQAVPHRRPATFRQQLYFFLGIAALWAGADWPVHALTEHWFSAHMLQHLLFSLVAAPLLILGTPAWLFRRLLRPRPVRAVVRFVTQPLVALLLFNGWTAGYHWPEIVNLSVRSDPFHFFVHVVWVAVSLVMWWPVLSPLPELPHLSYPARLGYLFGQSLLPTIPASFLTFGETAWYEAYLHAPRLGLSPVTDQQIAGLLMKIGGGAVIWGVIAVLFFRWQKEEETGGPDILYWRDIESDLELTAPK